MYPQNEEELQPLLQPSSSRTYGTKSANFDFFAISRKKFLPFAVFSKKSIAAARSFILILRKSSKRNRGNL
uniref:CSON011176 protein n=1 Tax=Culicoides sonorensis TaxID=179676 RepID=A0A336LLK8_CULSO